MSPPTTSPHLPNIIATSHMGSRTFIGNIYKKVKDHNLVTSLTGHTEDYLTARKYWNKLKQRLLLEGNETVTNCHQLKMLAADGKYRSTDVGDLEQILRLVQSIPSKKAEPFKRWLAHVGAERIHQMQDPELGIQQSLMDYKRLGYSDNWINQRLKSIEIRKDLTDQWKAHNVQEGVQYATLEYIYYKVVFIQPYCKHFVSARYGDN